MCNKCHEEINCNCPEPTSLDATPISSCDTVDYCDEGCVEIIDDKCVETRCGTLEEVIDKLFDEDCNAIPGCEEFGTSPNVNICQNEIVSVSQVWLNANPSLTDVVVHPIKTPEFVGSETFTPTLVGTYLFQASQYNPCFKAQLITLNVEDCLGICPTDITISNSFNTTTELFDFMLSSTFAENATYRIKVTLPDTTVIAELETGTGDISVVGNHVDNTNWNNFDQYLSTITLNSGNLNAGISFTFDKEQWATDNGYLYNSKSDTDATQLIFEFSIEKAGCPQMTGSTTVNRVVGSMIASAYAIYNNGSPGFLQYNLQNLNASKAAVFATDTVSVVTQLPATALPTITTATTTTTRSHTYTVQPLGTVPTELNQYYMSATTDLGHMTSCRGYEASGYDFTILQNIDSFSLQEENVADQYNINLRFRAAFQEAHWDETTIQMKTHFNSIGGAAISAPLVFTNGGTTSAANTHILEAIESAVLGVGNYQLYSAFICDFNYETTGGSATQERTAFKFSELELNYLY